MIDYQAYLIYEKDRATHFKWPCMQSALLHRLQLRANGIA
jgi:hypothetical protein